MSHRLHIVAALLFSASVAACQGRSPRAIQTNPPTAAGAGVGTAKTGGKLPGQGKTPGPDQTNPDGVDPGITQITPTATDTGTQTSTQTSQDKPPPSGGAGAQGLQINQTLQDGTTKSVNWDGKSFLGNDKFDVQGN